MLKTNIKNRYEYASKILQKRRKRLISSFLKGEEPDFLESHAQILDDYFFESFEKSMVGPSMEINKNPYAIIAVGGYGRKEQCVHSDVDLLFLFKKRIPDKAEDLIREILYPLWDIGLDIGYATRSLNECVSLAKKDIEVLTSLLDARYICGISLLKSQRGQIYTLDRFAYNVKNEDTTPMVFILKDKVAVVFGCWTSDSRKAVLPVFKKYDRLFSDPDECPRSR